MTTIKTVWITGASSGLGLATAKAFAGRGWLVVAGARSFADGAAPEEEKAEHWVRLRLDVTDGESCAHFVRRALEISPRVDALVCGAAVLVLGSCEKTGADEYNRVLDTNFTGAARMVGLALPYMRRGGVVLNTCSISSFAPNPRMTVYSASKAFMFHFSKSLRYELKPRGINVCAVCPGPMETDFLDVADIPGNSKAFATLPYCDPAAVAGRALEYARAGRGVYTPRLFYKFYRLLAKVLPHGLLMPLTKT